ncbi:MAG: NUDIX domain-containing protein [Candidatus Chromulinivorax sp.]
MKEVVKGKDASFGIIPLQKKDGKWQVFVVQSITGNWGFPKGHPNDQNETPKQTAQRELKEETGLHLVALYPVESLSFSYECRSYGRFVDKTVTLFVGKVAGNIHPCPIEIAGTLWIDLDSVHERITFEPIQPLLVRLQELVISLEE